MYKLEKIRANFQLEGWDFNPIPSYSEIIKDIKSNLKEIDFKGTEPVLINNKYTLCRADIKGKLWLVVPFYFEGEQYALPVAIYTA